VKIPKKNGIGLHPGTIKQREKLVKRVHFQWGNVQASILTVLYVVWIGFDFA
jgi:hypothetical protein